MGRKLDLSGLTDVEAEHVMQVVQRDMELRKTEEKRLNEMKKALVEEGSRSVLLSRQHRFNERCCILCCSPFTFLLNPKRSCLDCCYNLCKGCCTYSKKDKGWLCSVCQKTRLLKTQSLEWFYYNVRRRFKRFGSAKVLKNLYRRHAAEHGVLGSTYEESSMYESDSTFFRQSEEHSMAETINVALRVAEEAIDEAIAKAVSQTDSQEKQNEAHYLLENREELIEELGKTIVKKIVRRKKDPSEVKSGCNLDQNSEGISPDQTQSAFDASLWRSHSAFCLLTDEKTDQHANIGSRLSSSISHTLEMKKEEPMPVQAMPSWRSVDRLDNSMLQSPDGNWIAYQSNLLSRPGLLTKRKSLVYSVLERESGVVSAYDEMGSETEQEANGVWGAALEEFQRKMSANKQLSYSESYSRQATLPLNAQAQHFTEHTLNADTEDSAGQDGPLHQSQKTLLPFLKRKVPLEHRRPSSARHPYNMDINFNPGGAESSEDGLEESRVKRSRRRRKNKREEAEWKGQSVLSSAVPVRMTVCYTTCLEGKINEVVALKSNTEDTEETEDKQCSKSSEERVQEKNDNSQGDLIENREEQRDPTIQHSKYSAASLRSITTEVLKVLNATEDLIHGSMGDGRCQSDHSDVSIIPPDEAKRLDEQLGRLEENVYVAAGTVYGLEAELGDLEECARCISGSTSERELAHLEDQVASAAAQVQQSELQVLDISSRIAALKNAGLKLTPQTQFTKVKTPKTKTQTIGSSRKLRRRLPAPPKQVHLNMNILALFTHSMSKIKQFYYNISII
uniref:RabBD domain-containing protein n=1 Tax=Cyprinus carpio carpio TaxID=630221 RepID=A0A9J8D0E9_CYPCA